MSRNYYFGTKSRLPNAYHQINGYIRRIHRITNNSLIHCSCHTPVYVKEDKEKMKLSEPGKQESQQ